MAGIDEDTEEIY